MLPGIAKNRGRYLVLAAALLFSTGGAAIKACTLGPWQVAGFRSGIAGLALWLLLPAARRGWTWRTFLTGLFYAATLILFVAANKLTTSANAIFLQSTAPLYLLFLGPLVLREPVRRSDIVVMAAVGAGMALLFSGTPATAATAPNPPLGNLLAALSGFTWACTIAGLRLAGRGIHRDGEDPGAATVVVGNFIAFLACLPLALPAAPAALDVAVIAYLGLFQVGLAYVFLTRSLRSVPGLEASTLLLAEPVFNPVWSWAVHGENPGFQAVAGGLVIVLAALGGAWWSQRNPASETASAV